jgi:hypothetical protein
MPAGWSGCCHFSSYIKGQYLAALWVIILHPPLLLPVTEQKPALAAVHYRWCDTIIQIT